MKGKKVRVVLIGLHFAEYSTHLARALSEHHSVLLLVNKSNFQQEVAEDVEKYANPNLEIVEIPHAQRVSQVIQSAASIVSTIRRFEPQIIHCQEDTKDYLAMALPFLPHVPFLLTVHDPKPHSGQDALRKLKSRHALYGEQLRRKANGVIVHGERLLQMARDALPHVRNKVFSIPHGPLGTLQCGNSATGAWERGNCLFFGRIEEYKGLPIFVEAIRKLRFEGLDVKGVIAGRGTELDLLKPQLQVDSAFELRNYFLSPKEVVYCFRRANVVVMPYKDATQSGVAAYALGIGRPIVATNVGAIPDMVIPGISGLLVPPNDSVAVAAAIKRIVEHPILAKTLAYGALQLGLGDYSWTCIAIQTTNAYQTLLKVDTRNEFTSKHE